MRADDVCAVGVVVVPKEGSIVAIKGKMNWVGPVVAKRIGGFEDDLKENELDVVEVVETDVIPSACVVNGPVVLYKCCGYVVGAFMKSDCSCPYPTSGRIDAGEVGELSAPRENVTNLLPLDEVCGGVDWDTRECAEGR
jgi:hypothetical protein